jgi:hypothetical protein
LPIELAFFGDFPNPYGKDRRRKLLAIAKDEWQPDAEDFSRVVNQSKLAKIQDRLTTKHVLNFFAAIVQKNKQEEREDGSVSRIDLVTHSSPDWIALGGTIDLPKSGTGKPPVSFRLTPDPADLPKSGTGKPPVSFRLSLFNPYISELGLLEIDDNGIVIDDPQHKKHWTLADVQKKFAPGAKLVVYSCEAAAARSKAGISRLLQHMADTVGLEVTGFTGDIRYRYAGEQIFLRLEDPKQSSAPSDETPDYRRLDAAAPYLVRAAPRKKPG